MKNKINLTHTLIHIFFQAIAAVAWGFSIYSLMERGFNSAEAGTLMALESVVSFIGQPLVSNYIDNSKKYTVFDVAILLTFLTLLLFIANSMVNSAGLLLALIFVFNFAIYSMIEPLINSFSHKFSQNGIEVGFSKARALGSLSYGVMCVIFGRLTILFPHVVVLYGGILFTFLLLVFSFLIKKEYDSIKGNIEKENKEEKISYLEFIKNNKTFMALCLFSVGIFFGFTCIDNFMILVTERANGNSGDMGSILGFKALVEAIAIYYFVKINNKIGLDKVLKISAISFTLKIVITYFSKDVFMLYVSQILQMTSFAFFYPGMVEFVDTHMNNKEAVRAHSAVTMSFIFGTIFSSLIGGNVANMFGTEMMIVMALAVSFISTIGYCYTVNKLFK